MRARVAFETSDARVLVHVGLGLYQHPTVRTVVAFLADHARQTFALARLRVAADAHAVLRVAAARCNVYRRATLTSRRTGP